MGKLGIVAWLCAAAMALAPGAAWAAEPCALCARSVTVNSASAACFLERYDELAGRAKEVVAIDLEECGRDRGVVAALRGPKSAAAAEPSLRFIVSARQLSCLKQKLEQPAAPLDPSLTIDLGAC